MTEATPKRRRRWLLAAVGSVLLLAGGFGACAWPGRADDTTGALTLPTPYLPVPNRPMDHGRDQSADAEEVTYAWDTAGGANAVHVSRQNVGPLARTVRFNDGFLDEDLKAEFLALGLVPNDPTTPTPAFSHYQGEGPEPSLTKFRFDAEQTETGLMIFDVDAHDQLQITAFDRAGHEIDPDGLWILEAQGDLTVPTGVLGKTGPDPAVPPTFDAATATLKSAQPDGLDANRGFVVLRATQPFQRLEFQLTDDRGVNAERDPEGSYLHHSYIVLTNLAGWTAPK